MKKLFDIYEYLYYRTFIWQKRLNGEKWAMFSAGCLPIILLFFHFILPIFLLVDLCIYPLNENNIACFSFVFAVCISIYYDNRHNLILDKYQKTNGCKQVYIKKIWMFILTTIVWLIVIFFIYQILRPDEVQSFYPSEEVLNQLRNIRYSKIK